jgi:hypothetical protein
MNWIARIFLLLLGLVVMTALLFGLLCYVIYAAVRWLLTGRKPQVVMVWQQFSAMRKSFSQGEFRAGFQNPRGRNAPFARSSARGRRQRATFAPSKVMPTISHSRPT